MVFQNLSYNGYDFNRWDKLGKAWTGWDWVGQVRKLERLGLSGTGWDGSGWDWLGPVGMGQIRTGWDRLGSV